MNQTFIRHQTWAVFENPQNGYRERVPQRAWLWMLLFGIFYLIAKQSWMHAAILAGASIFATVVCSIMGVIGALLWPFVMLGIIVYYAANIRPLLAQSYLQRGWVEVDLDDATIEPLY